MKKSSIFDDATDTVLMRARPCFFWHGRRHDRHDLHFGLFRAAREDAMALIINGFAALPGKNSSLRLLNQKR
jgi:hypothetical protein